MKRKIKTAVFIATSIDGFIARKDGSLDWLDQANLSVPAGEDCGYKEFFNSVDVLIMGRKTFEKILTFQEWPYENKPVQVLSTGSVAIPTFIKDRVQATSKSPRELLDHLEKAGHGQAYIDGGATINSFLNEDLIDEITITLIPVALGEGIPLFTVHNVEENFELKNTRTYNFGYAQMRYQRSVHQAAISIEQ